MTTKLSRHALTTLLLGSVSVVLSVLQSAQGQRGVNARPSLSYVAFIERRLEPEPGMTSEVVALSRSFLGELSQLRLREDSGEPVETEAFDRLATNYADRYLLLIKSNPSAEASLTAKLIMAIVLRAAGQEQEAVRRLTHEITADHPDTWQGRVSPFLTASAEYELGRTAGTEESANVRAAMEPLKELLARLESVPTLQLPRSPEIDVTLELLRPMDLTGSLRGQCLLNLAVMEYGRALTIRSTTGADSSILDQARTLLQAVIDQYPDSPLSRRAGRFMKSTEVLGQ